MGFFDLFKPKWKHSNADVRAEAVRHFGSEDFAILSQVLRRDSDVRVRKIALKKVDDPQLLSELASSDPDEGLRKDAAEKASSLLLHAAIADGDETGSVRALERISTERAIAEVAKHAKHETVRRAALTRLTDAKALADVARKSDDPHIRRQATERVTEVSALKEIAGSDSVKEVALVAVERLDDPAALDQVIKKSKLKVVKNAAKAKLTAQREAAQPKDKGGLSEAKRKSRLALIARTVDEAATSDDWIHAAAAIEAALVELAGLGAAQPADEPFVKRIQRAKLRFELRREEHSRTEKARAELAERRAREAEAHKAQSAVEAEVAVARSEEDEKLREVADAARKEENDKRAAERALRAEEKAKRDAEKLQRDAEKAARQKEKDAEAEENLRRLEEVAARLESLASSDDRKVVESALKSADDVTRSGGNLPREKQSAARARYQSAREKLVIRMQELRETEDWKRFANVPKLEALVAKMEALLLVVNEAMPAPAPAPPVDAAATEAPAVEGAAAPVAAIPPAAAVESATPAPAATPGPAAAGAPATPAITIDLKIAAAELKAMQVEWKSVGAAPKDKSEALWKRFKAAADQVYERTKGGGAAGGASGGRDEERTANLKKKELLCEKVDALSAQPDEQINWKDTAEAVKALQEEWKGIGPTAREAGDAAWKRFRESCDKFFDRRKGHFAVLDEERGANLKKQQALCERVEALANSTEWKEAAEQIKGLQADWKTIGPAPKDAGDAVWKRFRDACDKFFDRRKAHFDQLDGERAGNLKKKELLCEKAEALAAGLSEGADPGAAMNECKKMQSEWKAIGPVPKDVSDAIWNRFRGACDKIFDHGRAPEVDDFPEPPPPDPDKPWPKFEHNPFAAIAEKLAAKPAAPAPPADSAAGEKKQLSDMSETIASAASEWEDIATNAGGFPTDKKKKDDN